MPGAYHLLQTDRNPGPQTMLTYHDHIDATCRSLPAPRVARVLMSPLPSHVQGPPRPYYVIVGTQYGYMRTTGGDLRVWRTASGARKALARYVPL